MRKTIQSLIAVLTLTACVSAAQAGTQVYKRVAPDGTVSFSDEPAPGAERVEIPPPSTIDLPDPPPQETASEPEKAPSYTRLAFLSPTDDEPVRANDGLVEVRLALEPALQEEAGHRLRITLDNEVVRENAPLSFELENVDRGTHSLTATVVDADGDPVMPGQGVTFHVLRVSAARP